MGMASILLHEIFIRPRSLFEIIKFNKKSHYGIFYRMKEREKCQEHIEERKLKKAIECQSKKYQGISEFGKNQESKQSI